MSPENHNQCDVPTGACESKPPAPPIRPIARTDYRTDVTPVVTLSLPADDAARLRSFLSSVVYVDGTIQVLQTYPRNLGIGSWNGPRFTPEEVAATLTLIGRTLTTEARI